jgi:ABC-2 type transport system ATP-binding protein
LFGLVLNPKQPWLHCANTWHTLQKSRGNRMRESTVVSVRRLSRSFGSTNALVSVDLEFIKGSVVGVLGPNGSGKSTLLKHIIGMQLPSSGKVEVFGTNSQNLNSEQVARIGYVSQETDLLIWLTVAETLAFAKGHHLTWDQKLADHLVSEFELDLTQKVEGLSGGQRQRLSIILGVAHRPDLLILDEPAASLDPVVRQEFLELLIEFIQNPNCTILISSHILTDVEKVIDQVLIMDHGSVHCFQPLDDLREEYFRVALTALDGDLPYDLPLSGIKHVQRDTKSAVLTIHNPDSDELRQQVAALPCTAKIKRLAFDEIYRLVVTGK